MSYTTYRDNPTSEKIVLVELDPLEDGDLWVNAGPGIWAVTYHVRRVDATFNFGTGAFGYGAFGTGGTATLSNGNDENVRINSFYDGSEWYSKVTTLTTLRTTDKSFYYDGATKILYVHFANYAPPDCFSNIKLGVSLGYANKGCYLDDIYYDARVLSVPAVGRSKDPLFFGKITFDGGTISLINADGEFDTFEADHDIYGAAVRILLGFEDNAYSDFKKLYEGYIENLRVSEDVFEIEANDKRKALSRKVPTEVFTLAAYPDLDPDDANKPIPLAYGDLKNVPVRCTNPEDGSGPWTFKLCDTTYHSATTITAVYVEGGTARTSVAWSGTSLTNATFQLTAGTYLAGKDKVSCDFQGYSSGGSLIANGGDIIKDFLATYFSKPFTNTFYNCVDWGYLQATTNLVTDPEDMTGWADTVNGTATTITTQYVQGHQLSKVAIGARYDWGWRGQTISFSGDGGKSAQFIVRRGDDTNSYSDLAIYDSTSTAYRLRLRITWATNSISAQVGFLQSYKWLDANTVWVAGYSTPVTAGNTHLVWGLIGGAATISFGYFTAFQAEDSATPTPYTATSRTAAADLALFVDEATEGWKLIEEIATSLHGVFIVEDGGTFTFRTYDSTRGLDQTIEYHELLNELEVAYNTDEVLSSVRVGYAKDWDEGTFSEYLYNSTETIIADTFKAYRQKTFDTLLVGSAAAASFAAAIMAIADDARPIFRARTKMQSMDRELSDLVRIEYKGRNRAFIGWMTAEVLGKTIDLDAMTVALTLRKT